MSVPQRHVWLLFTAAILAAGCGAPTPTPNPAPKKPAPKKPAPKKPIPKKPIPKKPIPRDDPIGDVLRRAGAFLVEQQSPDGAWRSTVYGSMKDGPSLTPLVLKALESVPSLPLSDTDAIRADALPGKAIRAARKKGVGYLVAMVKDDGTIDPGSSGWTYPVYSASLAVTVLSREEKPPRPARGAWLAFLRGHQLTEPLGWQPDDPFYGGWGYADEPPQKPPAGQQLNPKAEPNLSATVFALEALFGAGAGPDDPAVKKALAFVHRCQNFNEQGDPRIDDGGFFFLQADVDRNKAGIVDADHKTTTPRYRSYGSTTADGILCLLACGVSRDNARVRAAVAWLTKHFSAKQHPGDFPAGQELARDSLYYYYCASSARALLSGGVTKGVGPQGWPRALADELLRRQQSDGSWRNPAGATREDDPLVATALAVKGLAHCRMATMFGEGGRP